MKNKRNSRTKARKLWSAIIAIATLFCGAAAHPVSAQDSFYKGKTVTIVVGYSAGGGYDQYARLMARHLGNHIPRNPTVIVQNMPGAASMTSVRYLDATAPKDGTIIATFGPGLILESFGEPSKPQFSDYQWIGTLLRDIRICYASTASGVKSW